MYSRFVIGKKYLNYYLTAANGKGHGIHSPFVYSLVEKGFQTPVPKEVERVVEEYRKQLLGSKKTITVEDLGAGSGSLKSKERKVSDIARTSLKSKKYAQLLYKLTSYFQPKHVLELGTCLGTTTAYFAYAAPKVTTIEGSKAIASIAQHFFVENRLHHINSVQGNFDDVLEGVLQSVQTLDMAYIDGNHRFEPTVRYFKQLLPYMSEYGVVFMDDIHWSKEMEDAWKVIQQHDAVTMTIDLFFIGLVFFRKDFLIKQHFTIRY